MILSVKSDIKFGSDRSSWKRGFVPVPLCVALVWLGLKKERKSDFRAFEKREGFRGRLDALEYIVGLFWAAHRKDAGSWEYYRARKKLNSNDYSVTWGNAHDITVNEKYVFWCRFCMQMCRENRLAVLYHTLGHRCYAWWGYEGF